MSVGNAVDLGKPVGELVDVQGRAVHVWCKGSGSPTVWLENGWAAVALSWQPFLDALAQHTRVCAYERAGTGWSEPANIYRTAQNEAGEFAALLDVLGEGDPFILLAWSGGGPVAQLFAADHPEKVAGLVLMDAIPPDYDLWATQTFPHQYWQEKQARLELIRQRAEKAAANQLTHEDIAGWFIQSTVERYGDRYTRLLLNNPHYWWTYYWQNQFAITSGAQVRAKVRVSDVPLSIIIAAQMPAESSTYRQSLAQMWQAMQQAQAALSTRSEVIRVDASHAIFRDQPQVVIAALLKMIAAAKGR